MRVKAPSSVGDLKLHNSLAFFKTVLVTEFSSGTAPCNLAVYKIALKNHHSGQAGCLAQLKWQNQLRQKHPAWPTTLSSEAAKSRCLEQPL